MEPDWISDTEFLMASGSKSPSTAICSDDFDWGASYWSCDGLLGCNGVYL